MLAVSTCAYCGNCGTDVNMVSFKHCETFQEFPEFWAHALSEKFFERVQQMSNPLMCMDHFELECFNDNWTLKDDCVPLKIDQEMNEMYNDLYHDHMYWKQTSVPNFGPPFCQQNGQLICHLCGVKIYKVSVTKHAQSHNAAFFEAFDTTTCEHSTSSSFQKAMKCSNCRVSDDREQKSRLKYLVGQCFPLYDCSLKVVLNKEDYKVSLVMKQQEQYLRDRALRINSTPNTYEEALIEASKRLKEMNEFDNPSNGIEPESSGTEDEEMKEETMDEEQADSCSDEACDEPGPSSSSSSESSESKLSAYVRNMLLSSYTSEENEIYFERDQQNIDFFTPDLYSSFAEFQETTQKLNKFYTKNVHPTIQDLMDLSVAISKKYSAVVRYFQKRRRLDQVLCYPDDVCNRICNFKRQEHCKMQQISVVDGLKRIGIVKTMLKLYEKEFGDTISRGYVHLICDKTNTHPRFIRNTARFNFEIPILPPNVGFLEHRRYSDLGRNTKITKAMLVRLNEEYKKCPNLSVEKIRELCYYYHCDDKLIINWFEHRRKVGDNFIEFWKKPAKSNVSSHKKQ